MIVPPPGFALISALSPGPAPTPMLPAPGMFPAALEQGGVPMRGMGRGMAQQNLPAWMTAQQQQQQHQQHQQHQHQHQHQQQLAPPPGFPGSSSSGPVAAVAPGGVFGGAGGAAGKGGDGWMAAFLPAARWGGPVAGYTFRAGTEVS